MSLDFLTVIDVKLYALHACLAALFHLNYARNESKHRLDLTWKSFKLVVHSYFRLSVDPK